MIDIKRNTDGSYTVSKGNGVTFNLDYYLIERVTETSHWLKIQRYSNDNFFFIVREDELSEGKLIRKYSEIGKFSPSSKTFVASGDLGAALFYENGEILDSIPKDHKQDDKHCKITITEIGEEYNNYRPVKIIIPVNLKLAHDIIEKWSFYDLGKKDFLWPILKYGYTFNNGEKLDRQFKYCYSTQDADGKFRLRFYDYKARQSRVKDHRFDNITEDFRYVMCTLGNLYYLYYCSDDSSPLLVGIYTSEPKRNGSYLIAENTDGIVCLIRKDREFGNAEWSFDFIFKESYIINRCKDSCYWQIYQEEGGAIFRVPVDWRNITVSQEDGSFILRADTYGVPNVEVYLTEIRQRMNELREKSIELAKRFKSTNIPSDSSKEISKGELSNTQPITEEIPTSKLNTYEDKNLHDLIPSNINFLTTSDSDSLVIKNGYLYKTRKCNGVSVGDTIAWISNQQIVITKLIRPRTHEVCYSNNLDKPIQLNGYGSIKPVDFTGIKDEQDLLSRIALLANSDNSNTSNSNNIKPEEVDNSHVSTAYEEPAISAPFEENISEVVVSSVDLNSTKLPWSEVLNSMSEQEKFTFMMEYFNGVSFKGMSSVESFNNCYKLYCSEKEEFTISTSPLDQSELDQPTELENEIPYIEYNQNLYHIGDIVPVTRNRNIFTIQGTKSVFIVSDFKADGYYYIEGEGGDNQAFMANNRNTAIRDRNTPIAIVKRTFDGAFQILDIVRYYSHEEIKTDRGRKIFFTLIR